MEDIIMKKVISLLLPFLQIYGFYVLFHGHLSPGGGFAGGAILGGSMILFALGFGLEKAKKIISSTRLVFVESIGAISYIFVGLIGLGLGSNFLSNGSLGLELGIFLEMAIGLVVAGVLLTLFYELNKEV